MSLDSFLNGVLLFNKQAFIGTFLLVGYFLSNRRYFLETLCLILVSFAISNYLKFQFKMPLPPGIISSAHYGFPSGHMLQSVVMWGWLVKSLKDRKAYKSCPPFSF